MQDRRQRLLARSGIVMFVLSGLLVLAFHSDESDLKHNVPQSAITLLADDLFVSPEGSDANSGSRSSPFRTIQRAARSAVPGTTVRVAAGEYEGNIVTTTAGAVNGRIRYVSATRWEARITGHGTEAAWTNKGDYTDIVGFDVTGSGRLGILNLASHTLIAGNRVHDIAVSGGCTSDGGAGIMNANYRASDGDIVGNVVHDIGIPGACNSVQGIYHANLRGRIVNNVVYRAASYGIHLWHAANKVIIANNTAFANGSKTTGGGILIGAGDSPGGVVLDHTRVVNNIVVNNPGASILQYCYAGQNCIGKHNIVANNLVHGNGNPISLKVGSDTGTISADPQFVNYMADGKGDYRLRPHSPARNKGALVDAPMFDIDNRRRAPGTAPDIGAFQAD